MVSKSNVHGPATFMQNTGFVLPGFPSMGAWVSYGLGSLTDDLPAFVVLPDSRGYAPNGPANWSSGFLPAAHQGTMIRPGSKNPIHDLFPPEDAGIGADDDADALALLNHMNREHRATREGDSRLDARIASYEMAARLQLSAPEVLDLSKEPESVQRMYGLDDKVTEEFGRNCLIARRLLERGVRFVQLWSGADNGFPRRNWDSHEDIARDHGDMAASMDRPAAALLKDLKARGLLDDTIVMWTTEFGRMPCSQGGKGRDHNPFAFTSWVAGGGFKGGVNYGASDEWSYKAVEDMTYCYDLHATVLDLLGVDHTKLTFRHNGIDRRLTDVHGRVIDKLLA
jgi:arylsulfatase A-like enzyme